MKRSNLMSASAGFGVAVAVFVGSITPAHAVDYSVTQDCSNGAQITIDVALTVGDTYAITNAGCSLAAAYAPGVGSVTLNSNVLGIGSGGTAFRNGDVLRYSATTPGTLEIGVTNRFMVSYMFTVTGGPSAEPAPAGPADIVQQVGAPAGGCATVDRLDLNWSGVATGGWGTSWAAWANAGRGGAVCTRTLTYANGAWKLVAS